MERSEAPAPFRHLAVNGGEATSAVLPGTDGSAAPIPGHADTNDNEAPALRDAAAILARAEADEAAANDARLRHRTDSWTPLPPDAAIASLLQPGEQLLAVRRSAGLDEPATGTRSPPSVAGDLYLTTHRLLLLGRETRAFELVEMDDVFLHGDRLLVAMRDGSSFALDVEGPRLLRVEIAAARAALRA